MKFDILHHFFQKWLADELGSKVIFLHIPKTGGSTFRKVLIRVYSSAFFYCNEPDPGRIKKLLNEYECIELHVGNHQGKDMYFHCNIIQKAHWRFLKKLNLFIMFRDPVDRVISNYFELSRKRFREKGITQTAFSLDALKEHQNNKQVGYMVGKHPAGRMLPTRSDLQHAKELLHALRMNIGILERYSESLQLFEQTTGKKIPDGAIRIANRTDRSVLDGIDQKMKDLIREKNYLDQELYEYGLKIFNQQITEARLDRAKKFVFDPCDSQGHDSGKCTSGSK